jgi:hypothetical protein
MESHGGIMSTGENSTFVHQTYLANLPTELSRSKQDKTAKGIMNLALGSIFVRTCE